MSHRAIAAYNDVKQASTIRPALGTHLVTMCEKDAPDGLDINGFVTIPLPTQIGKITEIKLVSSFIVNSVYNVDTHNNTMQFRFVDIAPAADVTSTVTITPKQYDGDSLATALQTALNAISGLRTFTVDFDTATYKLTFERTDGNGTFQLLVNQKNYLFDQLGFELGTYPTSGPATTFTSTYPVNLMGPSVLYVAINGANRAMLSKDAADYFAEIQLADSFLSRNTNTFVSNSAVYPNGTYFRAMTLRFFMDNTLRTVWNFNNMPWRLTFEITALV